MLSFIGRHPRRVTVAIVSILAILAGIAVFLVVRLLVNLPAAESGSPSPSPSASVSQEPTIVPTPEPSGGEPSPGQEPVVGDRPVLATVLVDELQMFSAAGTSGTLVGTLQAGDVVQVSSGPDVADGADWWLVQAGPDLYGWISAGTDASPYLDLHSRVVENLPATITGVAAGDPGFLAWGTDARRSDAAEDPVLLVSADGRSWARVPILTAALRPVSAAWGPAGWLMVSADATNEAAGPILRSTDGLEWTELPALGISGVAPTSVVAGPSGYLMLVRDDRSGTSQPGTFVSDDGTQWREVAFPGASELVQGGIGAIPTGYVAWRTDQSTIFSRSADGETWKPLGGALPWSPNDQPLVAAVGSDLWTVLTDLEDGNQTVWRIDLGAASLAWERQPAAEAAIAGTAITDLASDGQRMVLLGHAWADAATRMWAASDGATFSPVTVTSLFGGMKPGMLTGSERGFVAVGSDLGAAGANPVLWSSRDGVAWAAEDEPVLGRVASPVVGGCPALPATLVDWLVVPPAVAVECFGDEPMTFSGWLTVAGGCGGFFPGRFEPAWLAAPYATSAIILEVYPSEYGGCGSAAQAPTLTEIPAPQQWVKVTGHFDDSAAATCTWTPERPYTGTYLSRQDITQTCRHKFVATEVVPAPD